MSVTTDAMTPERSNRLDEAFSDCLARVANLRPILSVKSGALTSLVCDDPPARDARIATCRSCNGAMRGNDRGRVLCRGCRANPVVLEGAPIITTMYHHGHSKYHLDDATKALIVQIGHQRDIAYEAQLVAKHYAYLAYNVHERYRRHKGNRNVHFTPERVRNCSYERELVFCNPRYTESSDGTRRIPVARVDDRHPPVSVGGLGAKLFDVVKDAALTWLYSLDAMIRAHFAITLERRPNDTSVQTTIDDFANLIAKRATLLERRDDDDPTTYLCTQFFEWIAQIQFVKCEHHAAGRRRADIRAMRELMGLARGEPVPASATPLADFLATPCPELLKALPSVTADMRFDALAEALTQPREERAVLLDNWRASIYPESLCMLLEGAIYHVQQWQPSLFLNCLRRHAKPASRPLPQQGWVDSAEIGHWSFVSRAAHAQRRTGLDPTGLRIVLMSSALMQLSAEGNFFVPGVMRCEMMFTECQNHIHVATHAYKALSNQMWPFLVGEPWRACRDQLLQWQGSHVENDVRRAGALLQGFSMNEIASRFLVGRGPVVEMCSNVASMARHKMVHKPEPHYGEWFPMLVELLLPILAQLRESVGLGPDLVADPVAEALRLLKSVRDWLPADGDVRITAGEAYALPELKSVLMRLRDKGSPLVRFVRPKRSSVNCWILNRDELARVLNK
ncbi:MAG: hypothetical protein CMI29_08415 [Opitutae bacterium]|nr:hypothetical protein [Opitutae bacterium]|tara:strand:+ start:6604 stop:8646 length:2043 start_codon:yes stop_codon:yes gene_type:complete